MHFRKQLHNRIQVFTKKKRTAFGIDNNFSSVRLSALLHFCNNFSLHCLSPKLLKSLTRIEICNPFSHIYFILFHFKQHDKIFLSRNVCLFVCVCLYVCLYLHFHGKVFISWTTQIKCFYNLQIPTTNGTQDDLYSKSREWK